MVDFQSSGMDRYDMSRLDEADLRYLGNYLLDTDVLIRDWSNLLDGIFVLQESGVAVAPALDVEPRLGGILFLVDEFDEFKREAVASGANSFAVVEYIGQKGWADDASPSFFRFAYPVDVAWEEMVGSCVIAKDVFGRPIRVFAVVTDNGKVGKFADNDALRPYELTFGYTYEDEVPQGVAAAG